MASILPDDVRRAVEHGPRAVLDAIERLEPDLALLSLWILHNGGVDPEYGRLLAMKSVRQEGSIATACTLWLMAKNSADLGVANTLLGGVERAAVHGRWPSILGGQLLLFLRSSLGHPQVIVRASVLSVLARAARRSLLQRVLSQALAAAIAQDLKRVSVSFVDNEDEREDVDRVLKVLREVPPAAIIGVDPRSLSRVAIDLIDREHEYNGGISDIAPLVSLVRRRVLMDDAALRAGQTQRPIQTLRVLADLAPTRVIQAVVSFAEAVVGTSHAPEYSDVSAPDFGTQIAWAPAASVSLHLLFADEDARRAFAVLEALSDADAKAAPINQLMDDLEPNVAEALLRLIARLGQHRDGLEVILSDPESADWQRSLVLTADSIGSQTISGLMKRARTAERKRGIIIHKDHVPQANTVRQVFQAVDAMLQKGRVDVDDIDDINSARQVNYYRQGARVLGFFDDDNQPTPRAFTLIERSHEARLSITAIFFEDSPIGRAWRAWARKDHLKDVDAATAQAFLEACVVGLSGTTPGRRASTLRAWFQELMPHYPAPT